MTELSLLELSARSSTALAKAGITSISKLRSMSDRELLRIPNFGRLALLDVRAALAGWPGGETPQPPPDQRLLKLAALIHRLGDLTEDIANNRPDRHEPRKTICLPTNLTPS